MKNNTKKIIGVSVILLFIAVILIIPSYSEQNEDNYPKLFEQIVNSNSILLTPENQEAGLYKSNDIYYFKGYVVNNYLKINDELWRIILIDKDNNITIIKEEGINNNKTYKYNNDYNNPNYKDSIIATKLTDYYKEKLSNINQIIEKEYCINYNETCLEKEKSYISLITPDILKMNDILNDEYNDESYLLNEKEFWILENKYDETIDNAFSGYVSNLGALDMGFIDEEKTIRPIITLSNKTKTNGEGTITNPYILY